LLFMPDEKAWARALARLEAYGANLPRSVDQQRVAEYHSLVDALEAASGEDLSSSRIPASEMKRKVVSVRPGSRYFRGPDGRPRQGRTQYSDEPFCNEGFFKRRVDGLWNYVSMLPPLTGVSPSPVGEIDYNSLTDYQLQDLAVQYRIPPAKHVDARGEHFYFDRQHFIRELRKRDGIESGVPEGYSRPVSKKPAPITPVRGSYVAPAPEPTRMLTDWPPNYPSGLQAQTTVIISEALEKFPWRTDVLPLCRRVVSQVSPRFCEAVRRDELRGMAPLPVMQELIRYFLVYNCDRDDDRYRLLQDVLGSPEWRELAKACSAALTKKSPSWESQVLESDAPNWPDMPQGPTITLEMPTEQTEEQLPRGEQLQPQRDAVSSPSRPMRLDPEVAKRRTIVRQNPSLAAEGICGLFDSHGVVLPSRMREAKTWARAYRAPAYRHAIHSLIARDRKRPPD
jgi:hypothetical protein